MLDQICEANPGLIAPIQWHVYSTYPLYTADGRAKELLYPAPYHGSYNVTPWLWIDGKSCATGYLTWENNIYNQMSVPSDVSLTHVGTTYDPDTRTGQVDVECYNSGVDSIDAVLQFAITEDSVNYTGPNGDPWHNHLCRDYVPDQYGTPVTLAAGATVGVVIPYSLDSSWVEEKVKLVVYLQNMTLQADSTMPVYQGRADNVLSFPKPGVEESKLLAARDLRVSVSPNPCRTGCEFALSGAAARGARITVYTPDGRLVSNVQTDGNRASWSRNGVSRGIYLYRVNAGTATAEGKLVVTD